MLSHMGVHQDKLWDQSRLHSGCTEAFGGFISVSMVMSFLEFVMITWLRHARPCSAPQLLAYIAKGACECLSLAGSVWKRVHLDVACSRARAIRRLN